MKAEALRKFLKKFVISNSKVSNYFLGKKLIVRHDNVFLVHDDFDENEIFKDELVFIKLKKFLPSTYLLEDIKNNTNNVLEIRTERLALDFTYGKPLNFRNLVTNIKLKSGVYYIVTFQDRPLGYVELVNSKIRNLMNVGDYLREN